MAPRPSLHFLLQVCRDGDLTHPAAACADGKNPDRAVPLTFAFFAMAAAGLVAANHSFHERTRHDEGGIGSLPREAFAGIHDAFNLIFHHIYAVSYTHLRAHETD